MHDDSLAIVALNAKNNNTNKRKLTVACPEGQRTSQSESGETDWTCRHLTLFQYSGTGQLTNVP